MNTAATGPVQGLQYVHLGIVPGHSAENTYCRRCRKLIIRGQYYQILEYHVDCDQRLFCSETIAGCYEKRA